ncbi:hypothetical protein [Persephonella marina]|nr:hypothetical protein [Persephonella marina]
MFKYILFKETPAPDKLHGYIIEHLLTTKDRRELEKRLAELGINTARKDIKLAEREALQAYEKAGKPLSIFIYRFPVLSVDENSDEWIYIDVEYYPVKELLKLIEKETGKKIKLGQGKIRVNTTYRQVILKQYNPEIKSYKSLLGYPLKKDNSERVYQLLKKLEAIFNDYS